MRPDDLIPFEKGVQVLSRTGGVGHLTGAHHRCQMEGCTGLRLTTKWRGGKITHPCTKGMFYGGYAIRGRRGWRIR